MTYRNPVYCFEVYLWCFTLNSISKVVLINWKDITALVLFSLSRSLYSAWLSTSSYKALDSLCWQHILTLLRFWHNRYCFPPDTRQRSTPPSVDESFPMRMNSRGDRKLVSHRLLESPCWILIFWNHVILNKEKTKQNEKHKKKPTIYRVYIQIYLPRFWFCFFVWFLLI